MELTLEEALTSTCGKICSNAVSMTFFKVQSYSVESSHLPGCEGLGLTVGELVWSARWEWQPHLPGCEGIGSPVGEIVKCKVRVAASSAWM